MGEKERADRHSTGRIVVNILHRWQLHTLEADILYSGNGMACVRSTVQCYCFKLNRRNEQSAQGEMGEMF